MSKKFIKQMSKVLLLCIITAVLLTGYVSRQIFQQKNELSNDEDSPYITILDNKPKFTSKELTTESYEKYSELDHLGRCGIAIASIGLDLMPIEKRGSIGIIKPSGWRWHTVRYDDLISDGKYLYNRCHLIGFQLSGENVRTWYGNERGMVPFENKVAEYVRKTGNHVAYRVTPLYEGNDLVVRGVRMEAMSVEDSGKGICFNVYILNVSIHNATRNSHGYDDKHICNDCISSYEQIS